jgi:hypothetical protein
MLIDDYGDVLLIMLFFITAFNINFHILRLFLKDLKSKYKD